jgi:hypothetical protein
MINCFISIAIPTSAVIAPRSDKTQWHGIAGAAPLIQWPGDVEVVVFSNFSKTLRFWGTGIREGFSNCRDGIEGVEYRHRGRNS